MLLKHSISRENQDPPLSSSTNPSNRSSDRKHKISKENAPPPDPNSISDLCPCPAVSVRMRPLNMDEEEGEMIVHKSSADSLSIVGHTYHTRLLISIQHRKIIVGMQPNLKTNAREGSVPTHGVANGSHEESKLELFGFDSLVNILGLKSMTGEPVQTPSSPREGEDGSSLEQHPKVIVRMRPPNMDEEEGEMIVHKSSADSLSIVGHTYHTRLLISIQHSWIDSNLWELLLWKIVLLALIVLYLHADRLRAERPIHYGDHPMHCLNKFYQVINKGCHSAFLSDFFPA